MAETTSLQNERDQILARWYGGGARATKISKSRKWEILVKSSLAQRSGDLVESEVGRLAQSGDDVRHDDDEVLGDGLMTSSWPQSQQRRAVVVQLHQTRSLHVRWLCTTHTPASDHTHTHTHPSNGFFFRTTRVGRYQKGKTNLDFTEVRDSEWQWHQLGHMQVCTSFQTDNHASTSTLSFLQACALPAAQPTTSKH